MRKHSENRAVKIMGIDLAKNSLHVYGVGANGRKAINKKFGRRKLKEYLANLPPCSVAMEACGDAHYWARLVQSYGHEVRLIAPYFVKPYVKSNKNDAADAEAICEAAQRPNMSSNPTTETARGRTAAISGLGIAFATQGSAYLFARISSAILPSAWAATWP